MTETQEIRVCVVIPTYNNATTLPAVIKNVRAYTTHIIVVNDGSTDSTPELLKEFSEVKLVSYAPNRGKGHALQQGFKEAVASGYTHAVTIDSDGQHYADDLPKFFEEVRQNPNAIIIGARNMDQSSVPGKSSFGNKFSNFWFQVETGIRRNDTQSGYRLYPVKALDGMKFFTKKYEFEIEVIVRAAWRGIDVTEVPVKVFYPEKEKRISHFRPFRDFSRISVLNTVLVAITFLYIKPRGFFRSLKKKSLGEVVRELIFDPRESDRTKAISIGFGFFMGIAPIWGFQLAIGIPLSFLFRLNKALFIIAANISVPPLIPLVLYISHLTGRIWMGEKAQTISFSQELTLELIHNNVVQYVYGAVTLAALTGVGGGLLAYGLLKLFRKKPVAESP